MTAWSARKRLVRRTTIVEEFDDSEVDYAPKARTRVTEFSNLNLFAKGWSRRISLHARPGLEPCVIVATCVNGILVSRIIIHQRNAGPVMQALEVAQATNVAEYREDTGSIALNDGARFLISGSRYRGRPGVVFQLFAPDGTVRGKPKTLFAEEFEALGRACAALVKRDADRPPMAAGVVAS